MSGFKDSIRYNLDRLKDFSGRETRAQFWPYAGAVVAVAIVGWWVLCVLVMLLGMGLLDYARTYEAGNRQMVAMLDLFLAATAVWFAVIVGLFAAAVARRLHDRGMRGLWGLLPLPFVVVCFVVMGVFGHGMALPGMFDMGMVFALFANNMIYLVTLAVLIVFLALKGTSGPNRYGEPPAARALPLSPGSP